MRLAGAICLAAFPQAVNATAEHSYRPGEYDLIDHGLVIYRIEGHRAYLVTGPKLVAVVAPGLITPCWNG